MKHMKMIVGALSIVVLLMVSILVYNRLNGHSNVVIPKSSQVKQTSTSKTLKKNLRKTFLIRVTKQRVLNQQNLIVLLRISM
ncbi:hypothetical protein D8B35_09010 [Lactococcus laudensis]|nr:hypothetical protein [Lactococcus laudensis]